MAYLQAVTSAAGFYFQIADRGFDKDGVDAMVLHRGRLGVRKSPRLDIQVKAHQSAKLEADPFAEVLDIKTYDELRDTTYQVPRILVVVLVPVDVSDWLAHSEGELVIRRCGYWLSLQGAPPTSHETAITVKIPRLQVFDVAGLTRLMAEIASVAPAGATPS